jgi:carboxypeptidase Taq
MSYAKLENTFRRVGHLDHAIAILEWDEAVMMPPAAGGERADATASLHGMRHQLYTGAEMADLIGAAQDEARAGSLSDAQAANLREITRVWRRLACLPQDLVEASKRAEATSEQAWRRLRGENDWAAFMPLQKEVVARKRETAAVLAEALSLSRYEALVDGFEPGLSRATINRLFAELTGFLPGFTEKVLIRQATQDLVRPAGPFATAEQRRLGERLMVAVGFDLTHGRLDVSHHPFCGGVPRDVRITTRYDEADFSKSMMAVLHEAGHGKYEQGLPDAWLGQPAGQARGMAMHESQSLLQEMQVSRSLPFLQFAAPVVRDSMPEAVARAPQAFTAENLYRLATRVERGYIRVDADEVTYPAHVILRYEIESALIEGAMEVDEIPEAWDTRSKAWLGLSTRDNFRQGCMQDVHWPAGLFGYFPSYTVGALTAAQLFAAARRAIPDLDGMLSQGEFQPLNEWLRDNVWRRASLFTSDQILTAATGSSLSAEPFKAHLAARYLSG